MKSRGAPTDGRFSHFRCEEAEVTDVDRSRWVVTVETKYTAKTVPDVQTLSPWFHYVGGEGLSAMPDVGAVCMVGFPSDNSPPFIMGFKSVPSQLSPPDEGNEVEQEVTMQAGRPPMNPGDMVLRTRDDNFIALRRGGVLQVGSTSIAQTVYIPIRNFIKQFCENYELQALSGAMEWHVDRVENDASGDAPCSFLFHFNEYAQDAKATVRARCFPAGDTSNPKIVWDFAISQKSISRDDASVGTPTYTLAIAMDGSKTEFLGANRKVTVDGDDTLEVGGNRKVTVGGNHTLDTTGTVLLKSGKTASLVGQKVCLVSQNARNPIPKGDEFVRILASGQWMAANGMAVTMSPATAAQLQQALSKLAFVK